MGDAYVRVVAMKLVEVLVVDGHNREALARARGQLTMVAVVVELVPSVNRRVRRPGSRLMPCQAFIDPTDPSGGVHPQELGHPAKPADGP
jgi:hypothetical protein